MPDKFRLLTVILSGLITSVISLYFVGFQDIAFSVVPGWHIIIYSKEMTQVVLYLAVLGLFLVIYIFYRLIEVLIEKLLLQFIKNKKQS